MTTGKDAMRSGVGFQMGGDGHANYTRISLTNTGVAPSLLAACSLMLSRYVSY